MKTKLAKEGRIDLNAYLEEYLRRDDAVRSLPTEAELMELARVGLVRDRLVLLPVPEGEPVQQGDTVTFCISSALPRFNKPRVTVSVGRGLYDKTVENALVGLTSGQSCHVSVNDEEATATVMDIRRKSAPEPTDEMAEALHILKADNEPIRTVKEYQDFIREEKTMEVIAEVSYNVMEEIKKDYPLAQVDPTDVQRLGQLELDFFRQYFKQEKGIDLYDLTKEELQENINCGSLDEWLELRNDWYPIKIHECLILLNILGLPCEGKYDPLDHYEVMEELTGLMFEKLRTELNRRNGK